MTTVAILHHTLNTAGGGARLCISAVKALKSRGWRVHMYTVDKIDVDYLKSAFGETINADRFYWMLPFKVKIFGIYSRLLISLQARKARKNADVTINMHGDALFTKADITYVHYPIIDLLGRTAHGASKYSQSFLWYLYASPYRAIQRLIAPRYFAKTKILTNSKFSSLIIKELFGADSDIVYPPVNLDQFRGAAAKRPQERDLVTTVARFTPEKRLDLVPEIAAHCPETRFVLIGATSAVSSKVISQIVGRAKKLNVLDRIKIITNAPFDVKLRILERTRIYLHTMPYEHFGISVVEAIAAGCVPVVHRSGGPWIDILGERQGLRGFAFEEVDEASSFITELMSNPSLCEQIRKNAQQLLPLFSEEYFKNQFVEIVEGFL